MAESWEDVEYALAEVEWEVPSRDEHPDALMGAYGKYHTMVSFEAGGPNAVVVSYIGKGSEILGMKWSGLERLPTPRSVVRVLSREA
jgi:hypothetical protein